MNDLKEGDVVQVTPSRFAYLFLESTAQRFRLDPEKDMLLLDELPGVMKIWQTLKNLAKRGSLTDTRLRNVQALLESKKAIWGDSDEFKHLAETTLKRANLLDIVTADDVLSGRFTRCLELYLHILKEKLSNDT